MKERSGLQRVASELGVAVSTVSRALSGKPGVSRTLRDRIRQSARELGVQVDAAARSLRTGKGAGVTVIVPLRPTEIRRHRDFLLFRAAREAFDSVRVLIHTPDEDLDHTVRLAAAARPVGILFSGVPPRLTPETRALLQARGIAVGCVDTPGHGFDVVEVDRSAGTYQAARMLLLAGCRNPLFFTAASVGDPDARMLGILAAYASLQQPPSDIQWVPCETTGFESGTVLVRNLARRRSFDGMFCYNDTIAVGALRGLHQEHIPVPDGCRVVGFDDIPVAAHLPVALTTVAQPTDEVVDAVLAALRARLAEPEAPARLVRFPARLVLRETAPVLDFEVRKQVFDMTRFEDDLSAVRGADTSLHTEPRAGEGESRKP